MRYRRKRLRVLARRVSVLSLRHTVSILSRIVCASFLLLPLPSWEIFPRTCRSPRTAGPRSPLVNNYQMKIPPPRVGWYLLFSGRLVRRFCNGTYAPILHGDDDNVLSVREQKQHDAFVQDSNSTASRRNVEIGPQYHTNLDSYYVLKWHVFDTFSIASHIYQWQQCFHVTIASFKVSSLKSCSHMNDVI